jgi:phosphomevalonate kinase
MSAPGRSRIFAPPAVRVRAPLKLVLAGEYAVLEPGSFGVVAAVARYVSCTASKAMEGVTISAPGIVSADAHAPGPPPDGALRFEPASEEDARRLAFVRLAAAVAYRYVADVGLTPRPLAIECESEGGLLRTLRKDGTTEAVKLGLGTSAGAAVSTAAAVLAAHGVPIDRPTYRRAFFRLALLAHTRAQGDRGSGIDVAASAHGGLLEYGRGDIRWIRRAERTGATPLEIVRGPWPGQHVEQLPVPRGLILIAGFTGAASATVDMLAGVERWKHERPIEHEKFIRDSQRAARGLAVALRKNDPAEIIANVGLARRSLVYLGERTGLPVETPLLEKLAAVAREAGGCGKLSGAGGGDCGYALAFSEGSAKEIEEGWREAGIIPIRLEVAPRGVREEALEAGRMS